MRQSSVVIGLTGNSGSGKSSVAGILASEYGAYIIDADEIAHGILLKGAAAYAEVVDCFGAGITGADGEIDRKSLGRLAFGDDSLRRRLMEITHKYIRDEMLKRLERARGKYPYIVLDAPLLVEAGLHGHTDTVWLVYAEAEVRLERIIARDGITTGDARARMDNQTAFDELKKYADVVLNNSGGLELLRCEVGKSLQRCCDENN